MNISLMLSSTHVINANKGQPDDWSELSQIIIEPKLSHPGRGFGRRVIGE
jgi:hypothetical protein